MSEFSKNERTVSYVQFNGFKSNASGQGTPMFIARAVQAGKPLRPQPRMYFPGLPPLLEDARAIYESNYPHRVKLFNGAFTSQSGPCNNPVPPFRHKLVHDGESGIWTAVWWSIQASPKNGEEKPIPMQYWDALMPKYDGPRKGLPNEDGRNSVLHPFADAEQSIIHPGYTDLVGLFESIATAIIPDYHWAADRIRQQPDFAHEILQRIILNFVTENKDAPFMDRKKALKNRKVERGMNEPHLSIPQTDSRSSSSRASKKISL